MGNSNDSQSFLQKGEGLRILSIKLNSPFDGKVDPFFDFIVDVIPLAQPQSNMNIDRRPRKKGFVELIQENEQKNLQIKIVSTKYRNVRSIMVTPNRNWNGSNDLIGITLRKQKFDQAFDSYFPVSDIVINSPVQISGIKEGQYLLGCLQFQYVTLDKFIQGLYDKFFDKQVLDKNVHLALYDMESDEVRIRPVLLKRGWGGNGLLGCEFLQGQLYKFPLNLNEKRSQLLQKQEAKQQKQKLRNDLGQCDGVSKALVQNLKSKQNKRGKHMQAIKNMISIPVPQIPQPIRIRRQDQNQPNVSENVQIYQQNVRIESLQRRVSYLEQTLTNIKQYIEIIASQQQNDEQKLINEKKQDNGKQQKQSLLIKQ